MSSLVEQLREESLQLRKTAWGRMDGGQECSLSATLADEAANEIERLREALTKIRDFEPSDGMNSSPYSQIAVFAKQTAREALSIHEGKPDA